MARQITEILSTVARELHLSEEEVLKQGLRSFLEHQLRAVKAEIFAISGRYGVSSVEEMDARYRDGTLEEADSWRDLQRLDHLEHKRTTSCNCSRAFAPRERDQRHGELPQPGSCPSTAGVSHVCAGHAWGLYQQPSVT